MLSYAGVSFRVYPKKAPFSLERNGRSSSERENSMFGMERSVVGEVEIARSI
jgi:hypothetical protein